MLEFLRLLKNFLADHIILGLDLSVGQEDNPCGQYLWEEIAAIIGSPILDFFIQAELFNSAGWGASMALLQVEQSTNRTLLFHSIIYKLFPFFLRARKKNSKKPFLATKSCIHNLKPHPQQLLKNFMQCKSKRLWRFTITKHFLFHL